MQFGERCEQGDEVWCDEEVCEKCSAARCWMWMIDLRVSRRICELNIVIPGEGDCNSRRMSSGHEEEEKVGNVGKKVGKRMV